MSGEVSWCRLLSVSICRCPEITGRGFWEHNNGVYVPLQGLDASEGVYVWVFRPCMVKQILYIGKASKDKIPHTWHFWNIKIPKPPYIHCILHRAATVLGNILICSVNHFFVQKGGNFNFWGVHLVNKIQVFLKEKLKVKVKGLLVAFGCNQM